LGTSTLLENEPEALFAHRCDWQGSAVFALHNLSDAPVWADLDLGDDVTGVDDILEPREHTVERGRLRAELGPYGYRWLRARSSK
jgi:maltose alpha-D-glucosyltransferase/alpha-amylase